MLLLVATLVASFIAGSAHAQGKVEAKYDATLAGIPIGKGAWNITIGDDDYSAATSGATSGLVKALGGGGNGSGTVQGRIVGGQFVPNAYISSVMYGSKNETIRINLASGNVKDFSIEPEPPVNPDRIPVMDAHRRGVYDPMTGSLFRVPGNGDVLGPDGCSGKTSIFDGRMRYDLQLAYKGREVAKLARGGQVPVVVCSIYFKPVAGYIPSRAAIKYLAAQRDMDVAFAAIAGTRVLVPVRIRIPTPIGIGMIEATEFNTAATPHPPKTN